MNLTHAEIREVEIGGVTRKLALSMAAFRMAQKQGLAPSLEEMTALDPALAPRLIWMARLAFEPELTEDDCLLQLAQDPECEEAATVAALEGLESVSALLKRLGDRNGRAPGDEGKALSP